MDITVTAVLLCIATNVYSQTPPHRCSDITKQSTLLMQKQRCDLRVEESHLNALCKILVGWTYEEYPKHKYLENGTVMLVPGKKYLRQGNELTMQLHLVSDKPVVNMTPRDEPTCLSLRRIWIKKWDDFKGNVDDYAIVLANEKRLGPFDVDFILKYIKLMSFSTIFHRPPQVAAALCKERRTEWSCVFDIYGFLHGTYNSTFEQDFEEFSKQWNIDFSSTETLNITLAEYPGTVATELAALANVALVRNLLLHKCEFQCIGNGQIPVMKHIEHIAFVEAPIDCVQTLAFEQIPRVRHISLVGTRLSGIPEAIFSLGYLATLDMSDTHAPIHVEFDYCPAKRSRNSTATRLILSGSKLRTLPSRAFCGFPMLVELTLDNCDLSDISGSPFECLEHLQVLSISGNHIRSLYGEHVKGLERLVSLNVSNNNVAYFQGSFILSALVSLRTLALSHNKLRKLELYSLRKIKIQELTLEGNHVHLWEPPLFIHMRELKKLSFAHNELKQIDDEMLHDIQHVNNVDFSWNPWDCFSCDLNNLHTLLKKHSASCNGCFLCGQPLEQYGVDVRGVAWRKDDCAPPDYYRVYGVPALMSFLVTTILANLVYRKRWYLMYALLYLKVTVKGYRRQRHVNHYLWDGFLSYHASDAEWVHDVLLPRLESPSMKFRMCLAERDFVPGLEIAENVYRAISQSRKSFFVLSHEFCRSRWCLFELSLAQHSLFQSNRQDNMVFIKKTDVDKSEMSPMLQYLIKSRTYIQLPPQKTGETLDKLFWLQLQAALEQ